MVPAKKNNSLSRNIPSTELLRITGMSSYSDNLKTLAKPNKDWELSPEQIVAAGKTNRKIYRIRFISNPVRFSSVEENPETTYVLVNDLVIGILDEETTLKLKELISSSDIHSVSCVMQGGLFKIIDEDCNEEVQQKGISAAVKISHQPKSAAVPAPSVKQKASTKTKKTPKKHTGNRPNGKKKEKKPFHKRVWVWIVAALLALGSCGNETDSVVPAETTIPTSSIIQTETTQESTTIPETVPVLTETPVTESYVAPVTEAYIAPATEPYVAPTPKPTAAPYVAPVTEDKVDMVWIPNSGKKYHSNSGCSNMVNPSHVTKQTAINRGFTACKRCYG
jgi:hypothetical protein